MIDAHQHFWQRSLPWDFSWQNAPELAPLRRDFLPADLAPLLAKTGASGSVVVQTQHDLAENHWALDLAAAHPFVLGVVGWVDLQSPRCEEQLLELQQHPKFVGIRHITHDEPDDDFIVRPGVLEGLKVLARHHVPFDLLFFAKHLPHATTVARAIPDLPLVIDHLAKPRIKQGAMDDWLGPLQAAAQCENVCCKLSGMVTEADWHAWKPSDLRPYIEVALEAFGPQRLMFGSDWPVCLLAGSYERVVEALLAALEALSASEREQILSRTAAEFYGLHPTAT